MHTRLRRWRWLLTGCVVLAFTLDARCAFACSCGHPPTPRAALQDATAVFAGTVTAIRLVDEPQRQVLEVTLTVTDVWKGTADAHILVWTGVDGGVCGVPFVEAQAYVVYATRYAGKLETDICARTKPLADAGADVAALGTSVKPAVGAGQAEQPNQQPAVQREWPSMLGVRGTGLLALLGMLVLAAWYRRRNKV